MNGAKLSEIRIPNIWPELFGKAKDVRLTEANIRELMQGTGLYKGIDIFYKNASEYIHFSQQHYYDLSRSEDSFTIGGVDTVLHEPLIKKAIDDFNFLQRAFEGTISLC